MCLPMSDDLKLFTSKRKKTLRDLVIDENGPGDILHDFDALLNILKAGEMPVTQSHQLPMRILAEINAGLRHPIQLGLQRPQQKAYPHRSWAVSAGARIGVDRSGRNRQKARAHRSERRIPTMGKVEFYGAIRRVAGNLVFAGQTGNHRRT